MFQFFLLILIVAIAIPVLRFAYRVWRLHRRIREFMDNPIDAARREAERQQQQQRRSASGRRSTGNPIFDFFAGWGEADDEPDTPRRKKKIPRDVGEYVKFTEIKETRKTSDTNVVFTREEQVQDVEWEDIK